MARIRFHRFASQPHGPHFNTRAVSQQSESKNVSGVGMSHMLEMFAQPSDTNVENVKKLATGKGGAIQEP